MINLRLSSGQMNAVMKQGLLQDSQEKILDLFLYILVCIFVEVILTKEQNIILAF